MYLRELNQPRIKPKPPERPTHIPKPDPEEFVVAIEERFANGASAAMFADALLGAGRLEEGMDEYRRANIQAPPDTLRSFGDRFLTEGDFDRAAAYFRAAGSEIQREQYARHWAAFLSRTESVEAILLHCQNLNLPLPHDRLIAIGDRVLAEAATADVTSLTHAFRAYKATGANEKLVQLGDQCRTRKAMDRELIDFVVVMYETAGASVKILEVARNLPPWAGLWYMRGLYAKAGKQPSPNDYIAFGGMKEHDGKLEEAIEAFREAGAVSQLRDLAQRAIDREQTAVGRMDLSPGTRQVAIKAFNAIASLEDKLAA